MSHLDDRTGNHFVVAYTAMEEIGKEEPTERSNITNITYQQCRMICYIH